MATEWTDALGQAWEIKDGNHNFNEWCAGPKKEEYEAAGVAWHAGDKTVMEALFAAWVQTTGSTKK